MKTFVYLLASALALGGIACTPPEVHTGSLDTAPYSTFHTFSFVSSTSAPRGYKFSERSQAVIELMKPTITEILVAKGYVAAPPGESDIVIVCGAGRREVEEKIRLPWRMTEVTGEDYEDHDFTEGGLVVDVYDKAGGQIWHGAATREINPDKPSNERLHNTVEKVMQGFPSHVLGK